jgi:uncharacterized membrane protein YeaQ/YmgE (transglycosylase-associated protein family)
MPQGQAASGLVAFWFPSAYAASKTEIRVQKEWDMGIESLLVMLIIGAIAGWLAGRIVEGYGFGTLGNIVVGVVGAFIAGLILPRIGFTVGGGLISAVIHSTLGAVILLVLIRLVKRA